MSGCCGQTAQAGPHPAAAAAVAAAVGTRCRAADGAVAQPGWCAGTVTVAATTKVFGAAAGRNHLVLPARAL